VTLILLHQTLLPNIEDVFVKLKNVANEISSGNINCIIKWEILINDFIYYIGKINLKGNFDESEKKISMLSLAYLLVFSTYPSFIKAANNFYITKFDVFDGKIEVKKELTPVEMQVINFINNLSCPLEQRLLIIRSLIKNHNSEIYDFFNAYIFYSHLYKKQIGQKGDKFLFTSIYEMPLEERNILEKPLVEKGITRGPWEIDYELLDFAESHPIQWGKIILRSFPYMSNKNENKKFDFLTLNEHILLIKQIEEFFGSSLDFKISSDILYFQMAKKSLFEVIKKFEKIRDFLKIERTKWPALTYDNYVIKENLNSEIFEGFPNVNHLSNNLFLSNNREYMKDVVGPIAMALAFAAYPIPLISFKELIINYEEFEPFHPMHDLFPNGPVWKACWEKDEVKCLYTLSVCIANPEKSKSFYIQFDIQLEVPENLDLRKDYLSLLLYAVDNLGKEVFDDHEFQELEKKKALPPNLTQDILYKNNGKERLTALLECSPFVKREWEIFLQLDEKYEISLFIFIQTLRRKFLDSFYYILDPAENDLEEGLRIKKCSDIQIISKNEKEILEEYI
jgi:hypothetical protein